MNKIEFVEKKDRENLGKYFHSKAFNFALKKDFGKSYEFFKESLDFLTCDCCGNIHKDTLIDSEQIKIFNDIENHTSNYAEYFFTKAYIFSFCEEKKYLYLALYDIDKYLELVQDEYGNYVKGKILLSLDEPNEALDSFYNASSFGINTRLNYYIGKTKEEYSDCGIEERYSAHGLNQLYNSFIENPSSVCCGKVLQKYSMKHKIELQWEKPHIENLLLVVFIDNKSELGFFNAYKEIINRGTNYCLQTINIFLEVLKLNYQLYSLQEDFDYSKHNDQGDNERDDNEWNNQPSYEEWLGDEFGDDAETAYWNLD